MMSSSTIVTTSLACLCALGLWSWNGKQEPVVDTPLRTTVPAMPMKLPGNLQWSPLRASLGERASQCQPESELDTLLSVSPQAPQQEPVDNASQGVAVVPDVKEEPVDNASEVATVPDVKEEDPPKEQVDNMSLGVPAAPDAKEPTLVPDPYPKAIGTCHQTSDLSSAPGISQLNYLTDQLIDIIETEPERPFTASDLQDMALEAGKDLLERATTVATKGLEAGRDLLERAAVLAAKGLEAAGVEHSALGSKQGAIIIGAVLLDLFVMFPLFAYLRYCCRKRSPSRKEVSTEEDASCEAETAETVATSCCTAETSKAAAAKEGLCDQLVKKLPSPMRTCTGLVRGPAPTGPVTTPGGTLEETAAEEATPPPSQEPEEIQANAEEEEMEKAREDSLPDEETHTEEEVEPEACAAQATAPQQPVRRGQSDLMDLMRQRRENCTEFESAPDSCSADILAQKVYAPQASAPQQPERPEHSPVPVRRGRNDLMDLMRQRRENCTEFESAPDSCNADILAEKVPQAALAKQMQPGSSPVLRRDKQDFVEVMRKRRESCHEFGAPQEADVATLDSLQAVPPLPNQTPKEATVEASPSRAGRPPPLPRTPERPCVEEEKVERPLKFTPERPEEAVNKAVEAERPLLFTPEGKGEDLKSEIEQAMLQEEEARRELEAALQGTLELAAGLQGHEADAPAAAEDTARLEPEEVAIPSDSEDEARLLEAHITEPDDHVVSEDEDSLENQAEDSHHTFAAGDLEVRQEIEEEVEVGSKGEDALDTSIEEEIEEDLAAEEDGEEQEEERGIPITLGLGLGSAHQEPPGQEEDFESLTPPRMGEETQGLTRREAVIVDVSEDEDDADVEV